jgi:hypothetical protein
MIDEEPPTRGTGDGRFAVEVARRVDAGGRVDATELEAESKLDAIRATADATGVVNVEALPAQTEVTGLPSACCTAIVMRYHDLTAPAAVDRDVGRSRGWWRWRSSPRSRRC